MIIGTFHKRGEIYSGRLRTLGLDAEITVVASQRTDAADAPQWRLYLGECVDGVRIGSGYDRIGERAGPFIAVRIDGPLFAQPLRANLIRSNTNADDFLLFWSRASKREGV